MLHEGEKAASTKQREAANDNSVRALHDLLTNCNRGKKLPKRLAFALRSQRCLAGFEDQKLHIRPMSLNTLKTAAHRVLGCSGWEDIDALRKALCEQLQREITRPGKVDAKYLWKEQYWECRENLRKEAEARLALEAAYLDALQIIRHAALYDDHVKRKCQRHLSAFRDSMRLKVVKG